ncbi:MAG: hypothetical protein EBZ50_12405, partial [Alphaproteobacteria bacterium]|nr:hypothetical protein [Alphaproteobacteria bacterium]
MNLRKKILRELGQMTVVPVLLIGLGIYAHEFVISGLMAKPELNFSIIGAFVFALGLAYAALFGLFADISGLDAIRTDYMRRRRGEGESVYDKPATVFARPKLLGYGYRLITEELQSGASKRLPTETVHLLIADVDMRVAETRATLGYFGGLLILLGLLGAFMGLMKTVHAVSDLIGAMDMSGAGGTAAFSRMIEGMKGPLNGMSVGFSSSLFGLLFSLALGVVDRFLINAMKAVRNEFEALLINLAQLDTTDAHGESHSPTNSGAGTRQGPGLGAEAGDDLVALRLSNDRIHDALAELNATAAGASMALRVQRSSAPIEAAVQRAFEGLIGAQREMAAQMARFADAAV